MTASPYAIWGSFHLHANRLACSQNYLSAWRAGCEELCVLYMNIAGSSARFPIRRLCVPSSSGVNAPSRYRDRIICWLWFDFEPAHVFFASSALWKKSSPACSEKLERRRETSPKGSPCPGGNNGRAWKFLTTI